jgi:hypothetical protein
MEAGSQDLRSVTVKWFNTQIFMQIVAYSTPYATQCILLTQH